MPVCLYICMSMDLFAFRSPFVEKFATYLLAESYCTQRWQRKDVFDMPLQTFPHTNSHKHTHTRIEELATGKYA